MTRQPDTPLERLPAFPEISYRQWRRSVERELEGRDFDEALLTRLPEGVSIEPLYTASHPSRQPEPAPATRGLRRGFEGGRPWIVCQSFDHPDLDTLQRLLHSDVAGGVTGACLRFDRAARAGADVESSTAAMGRSGIGISCTADLQTAFAGLESGWQLVRVDAGGNALPAAGLLLAWLEQAGIDPTGKLLHFGADPLAALARDGRLPGSMEEIERDLAALARHCRAELKAARALTVSGTPYREAGADIDLEMACMLSSAVHYLRALEPHGLDPVDTASQMVFECAISQDLFAEVAKLRAFRSLWHRVLTACGVDCPPAPWLHATVLHRSLPRLAPWLNLLRITTAGLAAAIGGVDSLETPAHDLASSLASDRGRRLARNVQLILAAEAHLGRVRDPGGGSYYLETLTGQLEVRAWEAFRKLEATGGMLAALRSGWIRERIGERWKRRRRRIAHRQIPITGVTHFADPAPPAPIAQPDGQEAIPARPRPRVDSPGHGQRSGEGSRPPRRRDRLAWCRQAAARGAGIDEMTQGLYPPRPPGHIRCLEPRRDARAYERLRDEADRLEVEGKRPKVYLALLAPYAEIRREVEFARDLLQAGGLEVVLDETSEVASSGADAVQGHFERCREAQAELACLCGLGDAERSFQQQLAAQLRRGAVRGLLAVSSADPGTRAGADLHVDCWIYPGCPAAATLAELLRLCGGQIEEVEE